MRRILFVILAWMAWMPSVLAQQQPEQMFATNLYFSQVAVGGIWNTAFLLKGHQGGFTGTATLSCYKPDGSGWQLNTDKGTTPLQFTMQGTGTVKITAVNGSPSTETGSCELAGNILMSGNAVMTNPFGDTTVDSGFTRRGFMLFVDQSAKEGRRIGLAIANPIVDGEDASPNAETTVTLQLLDANGLKLGGTQTFRLAQNGQRVAFLDEAQFFGGVLPGEFLGSVRIDADSYITVMSVAIANKGSSFSTNVSPAMELDFDSIAELEKSSVQLIHAVPKNVPVDMDYEDRMRFVVNESLTWYGKHMGVRGMGHRLFLPIISAADGKPVVRLEILEHDSSVYEDESTATGSVSRSMELELQAKYGKQVKIVSHQANVKTLGVNAGGFTHNRNLVAYSAGPSKSTVKNYWKNFSLAYLNSGIDAPRWPGELTTSSDVTRVTAATTHEVGHMLGLPHTGKLAAAFPNKYCDLMNANGCGNQGAGIYSGKEIPLYFPKDVTMISTSELWKILHNVGSHNLRDR